MKVMEIKDNYNKLICDVNNIELVTANEIENNYDDKYKMTVYMKSRNETFNFFYKTKRMRNSMLGRIEINMSRNAEKLY